MGIGPNGTTVYADENYNVTAAELGVLDGVTAGTTTASKALVAGASSELDALTVTSLTATSLALTNPLTGSGATGITAYAGGAITNATALTKSYNNVTTCASNYDSVKLPIAALGKSIVVRNSGAAILSVFPITGTSINSMAASLSVDIPVGGQICFDGISATAWKTREALTLPAPSTQKGNLVIKAADAAGNTQTLITNDTMQAARTITVQDPGATTSYLAPNPTKQVVSISQSSTPASGSNATQFTFKDAAAVALSNVTSGLCYLSSDSAGATPVAAGTSMVTLTNGTITAVDAGKKIFHYITTAAGLLGVTLTSGAGSYYVNFMTPCGKHITSTVLTVN